MDVFYDVFRHGYEKIKMFGEYKHIFVNEISETYILAALRRDIQFVKKFDWLLC